MIFRFKQNFIGMKMVGIYPALVLKGREWSRALLACGVLSGSPEL